MNEIVEITTLVDGTGTEGETQFEGWPSMHDVVTVFATGWSNDTFNVEYKPTKGDDWSELANGENSTFALSSGPPGYYRVVRSGNNDDAVVKLVG